MDIKITIAEYEGNGLQLDWEYGFKITTTFSNEEVRITANKEGLISLAKQLLTLAQDNVPAGHHFHYDENSSLEAGSMDLIIDKI